MSLAAARDLPAARILRAVADAAERWRNADFPPRVRATRAIMERLAYSEPMVDHALDRLFSGITVDALKASIESELGSLRALDDFVSRPGRPDAFARGAERVTIVASDTTIGVAVAPLVFALCAKSRVLVKDRSDALVAGFAHTLIEEEPWLAERLRVEQWESDDDARSQQAVGEANVVVAFGRDATMRAIRARCEPDARFVPFGHRLSVGYVPREALVETTTARQYARGAAVDALLYEGEGCLSLRALFVERGGELDPPAFAALLAAACEEVAVEFPSARPPDPRVAAYRKRLAFRAAQGAGALDVGPSHLVALDPPRDEPPPLLPRVLPAYAVNEPQEMLDYLREHRLPLEAIATVAAPRPDVSDALLACGASRIAPLGRLQDPPLSGNHGGQGRIAPFVTFVYRDDK